MSEEAAFEALRLINSWHRPLQIHITGGEPFLNFSLLLTTIQAAAELGIARYVETNAGWCLDEDLTGRRFTDLARAGLQAILVSCSPFHAETIPPVRTMLAVRKATEIFGLQRVMVYQADWLPRIAAFGEAQPAALERYVESFGSSRAGHMFWREYGLIPGGRSAYRLGNLAQHHPAAWFQDVDCATELLDAPHSHFDLYGNFIPAFCGGISLGPWREFSRWSEEFRRRCFPPLIKILVHEGPYGLFQLACTRYGYKAVEAGYVGKCHLCVDVRRHLVQQDSFTELQPALFYEMF